MAKMILTLSGEGFDKIADLAKLFPTINSSILGYVGAVGKRKLKREFLSGQELNLKTYPLDRAGKRTVKYALSKNRKSVYITSYPLNLFENNRVLRSGRVEPGRKVMTRKFKQLMMSDLNTIVRDAENKIVDKIWSQI